MGLTDRLREAARPINAITDARERAQERREDLHRANPSPAAGGPSGGHEGAKKKGVAYQSEPDDIAKAYYVEDKRGERRYYDDYRRSNVAMRATDAAIWTKREDLNTIRAMVDIAAARGWDTVHLTGTKDFKREAWIEAAARGIEAKGYRPSDPDRQEADRRRAERGLENEMRGLTQGTRSNAADPGREPKAEAVPSADQRSHQDNRRAYKEAQQELSPDGRTMLAALVEKIDRQMNKLNNEHKAEMKAFVATELVKKERAEGPIVLSAEQKRAATAPEPVQSPQPPGRTAPEQSPRQAQEEPRLTRGR
ncbi:LPD7 domain-containing protein [Methylobacterium radiotolerans]|uniref:LPD7 domain-containing protein n=1 Tax=Methylobacterium radiotolerans TaxID=31998 RepID=UPI001115996F|nr:LPD7 domain-containing protein [Methylobacterium radiotolerans]